MLSITQQKCFVAVSSGSTTLSGEIINNKDFWRLMYASLGDNAMLSIKFSKDEPLDEVQSLMKMNGFANIEVNKDDGVLVAIKPLFKAGGTSLKNRKK